MRRRAFIAALGGAAAWPRVTACAATDACGFGGCFATISFSNHKIRERRVGGAPRALQVGGPLRTETAFQRPQQRFANWRVVYRPYPIRHMTLCQCAGRR